MSSSTTSSSDTSSSPDEDAAAAAVAPAAAEAVTPATVTPGPKRKRKVKATASVTRDVIVEVFKAGLGTVFNEKAVDGMVGAIMASSRVAELVEQLEAQQGAGAGSRKRAKGTAVKVKGRLSSAYTMFVTQMFGVLKAAGIANISLQDVSGLWQALPEELREDIVARFNAIKDSFNAGMDAGEAPNLSEALAAHARQAGLAPIPFMEVYHKYKDSAKVAAAAAAAAGGGAASGGAKAKPVKKATPAAPAAAAAAAPAAAPGTEEKSAKKHKKDKEKKKKHKPEGDAAPTTDKKKKKHKHDKAQQQDSD
ncbi:hypothetical protein OEZ86_000081 [Tetradesmus obliquus]|nr:hypothetical protein OEZ86_000081 [Tetradesmus obliquus]